MGRSAQEGPFAAGLPHSEEPSALRRCRINWEFPWSRWFGLTHHSAAIAGSVSLSSSVVASFKVSGIEPFYAAVRHKLPLLCVISLNGGWSADPEGNKPGRYLGYTPLRQDGRGARQLRRVCRRARGHPTGGPAACLTQGRGGHGRLCQRQDRLPRPRDDGALLQPRDLSGPTASRKEAPSGAPFSY
jgi:hypothetical protein